MDSLEKTNSLKQVTMEIDFLENQDTTTDGNYRLLGIFHGKEDQQNTPLWQVSPQYQYSPTMSQTAVSAFRFRSSIPQYQNYYKGNEWVGLFIGKTNEKNPPGHRLTRWEILHNLTTVDLRFKALELSSNGRENKIRQ